MVIEWVSLKLIIWKNLIESLWSIMYQVIELLLSFTRHSNRLKSAIGTRILYTKIYGERTYRLQIYYIIENIYKNASLKKFINSWRHFQESQVEKQGNQDWWNISKQPKICRWYKRDLVKASGANRIKQSNRVGLKMNIAKTKIMSPINL